MYRFSTTILPLLTLVLFSGCGSTNTASNQNATVRAHQTNTLTKESLEKICNDFSVEVNNTPTHYLLYYKTDGAHTQHFIDKDRINTTGYRPWENEGIGAEYLIEDNHVFQYTGKGGLDWSWKYLFEVPKDANGAYLAKMDFSYFDPKLESFDLQSMSLDGNWETICTKKERTIARTIDYNANKKVLDKEIEVSNDALNYYFSVALASQSTKNDPIFKYGEAHHQFYINTDQDLSTGYTAKKNLGAEYLLEDDLLYRYDPNSADPTFPWQKITRIYTFIAGNRAYFTIPKKEVPLWQETVKISVIGRDASWENIYQTDLLPYPPNN